MGWGLLLERTQGTMDSEQPKDAAAVKVIPPLVPLGTILIGFLLNSRWRIDSGLEVSSVARYWVGGLIIFVSFFGLGLWAVVLFRRTDQSVKPWESTPKIVDGGPFRLTRNPMYLQMILICIGFAVIFMNVWILLLAPVCVWILQTSVIVPEEEYLERKFGEVYLAYKRRVRRWF